jgi:DNA-binding CsgD family transcriptional regulator
LLRRIGDPERVERPTRQVRTARSTYRLAGSLLQESVLGRAPVVAVTLARETPEPRSDAALRQRFGLTERQFEVGRLMAEGLSNGAIADLLGVTRHTAARHAEQVRAKLGVHSRAAVGARLRSD